MLAALAMSRVTASSVTLAATLWTDQPEQPTVWSMAVDPAGLVAWVLDGMADKDLVTYRLKSGPYAGPYSGMPLEVRLTNKGWVAAGYPQVHGHVGHASRHSADNVRHTGDMTNYRNHHDIARGVGPIEVLPLAEHRAKYPGHIHPLMFGDSTVMNPSEGSVVVDPQAADTRVYTRVTPELEARVIAIRARLGIGAGYKDIAEVAGIPERTARYILVDLPHLRRTNDGEEKAKGSLKQRIVWVLEEIEVDSATELRRILGRGDTAHDVVHVLHSLHKEGKVDFDESDRGGEPVRIHLRKKRGTKRVEDDGPAPEPTPEPEPDEVTLDVVRNLTFPLLDALIEREGKRLDADNRAMAYLNAAESLKNIDPAMYTDLVSKAEQSDIPFPSPIEAEYLRYVQTHKAVSDE